MGKKFWPPLEYPTANGGHTQIGFYELKTPGACTAGIVAPMPRENFNLLSAELQESIKDDWLDDMYSIETGA